MADQPDIVESIGSDVLPASIEIQLEDPRDSEAVAEKLRDEGFTELSYPQQIIENLNQVTGFVVWALRGATALLFVASVLLIFNTIRLSTFGRREDNHLMKIRCATEGVARTTCVLVGLS